MSKNKTGKIVIEHKDVSYDVVTHDDADGYWFQIPSLDNASGVAADGQTMEEGILELIECMVGDDFIPEGVDPVLIG